MSDNLKVASFNVSLLEDLKAGKNCQFEAAIAIEQLERELASQQAAHDAEIASIQITLDKCDHGGISWREALRKIDAIVASHQQVSEWEAKKLEPLRAQVAMLYKAVRRVAEWDKRNGNAHHPCCNFQPTDSVISHGGTFCNCGIVDCVIAAENTQSTAEQFIAECKLSAIERYDLLDEYEKAKYRLELRATSKKAG